MLKLSLTTLFLIIGKVSMVLSSSYFAPDSNSTADIEAANRGIEFKVSTLHVFEI